MSVSFFVFLPVKNPRYKCFCYKRNPYENIIYHSSYSFSKQNALQIMMLRLSDLQGIHAKFGATILADLYEQ